MNYIEELNAFNQRTRRQPLPMAAKLLWYALMDFSNRLYWPEWFSLDNDRLAEVLGAAQGTAKTARDQLVKEGYLEIKRGTKGHPNQYHLVSVATMEGFRREELPEVETLEDYCESAEDITRYFGYTEALGAELKKITRELIGQYWPEHTPDVNDERRIFFLIKEQEGKGPSATMSFPFDKKSLLGYAFEQSSEAAAHNWKYIYGCYRNFAALGITNVEQAYENEARRAERR